MTLILYHNGEPVRCSVRQLRAEMSEEDFWESIFGEVDAEDLLVDDQVVHTTFYSQPCSDCGEYGPCGYDSEGRPMFHAPRDEDEDE